jgi:hypothetical protein
MRTAGIYRGMAIIVLRWIDDIESALVIKTTLDHGSTQQVFAPELLQWTPPQRLRSRFSEYAHLAG